MKEIRTTGKLATFQTSRVLIVGESRQEAISNGAKFYLGKLCENKHHPHGELSHSVRYTGNCCCIICQRVIASKVSRDKLSNDGDAARLKARRSIEDIKLARELGISVDEL